MNNKPEYFSNILFYGGRIYPKGTEFIYNGECLLNGTKVRFDNTHCTFLYRVKNQHYFQHKGQIYMSEDVRFPYCIVKIIPPPPEQQPKQEFIFTDEMLVNTIWYILIMLVAIMFKARWVIWICGTFIYYMTTFYNKK